MDKGNAVDALLKMLGFHDKLKGYQYLHFILIKAWTENNTNWDTYSNYVKIISKKKGQPESKIFLAINLAITRAWRINNYIRKVLFPHCIGIEQAPDITLFMRTLLAILFFCEKNRVSIAVFSEKTSVIEMSEHYSGTPIDRIMIGYIVILLKKLEMDDALVDRAIPLIADIIKTDGHISALVAYIKHTSELFAAVSFDGVDIPHELYNMHIGDLCFENNLIRSRVKNALIKSGVMYVKDLRYTSCEEIKKIRQLGDASYKQLISALKKTSQSILSEP